MRRYSKSCKIYMGALKNSGFKDEFTYKEENIPMINKKYDHKNRKRIYMA